MEEQQNNNLSVEILNGNTELVTGLVGNAQALKEPGTNYIVFFPPFLRLQFPAVKHLTTVNGFVFFSFFFPETNSSENI